MPRALACVLLLLAGCAAEPPDEVEAPPVAAEGWQVHEAGVEADEDHPGSVLLTRRAGGAASGAFRPRLVLGCEEGVTLAYVEWGTPLGDAAEVPVQVRVDDAPEQPLRWQRSHDGEAAGLWDDSTSVPFLRTLLGHARLATRVTPAGAAPLTATFALDGLDSLIVPVRALCGWE
jgi:type VI secretion system VasI family protein